MMHWRDIGLFWRSARTDAAIHAMQAREGTRAAFETIYRDHDDPWASADPRYHYQRRKYDGIMSCLPPGRRFGATLELGCGLGLLTARLATCSDTVLGIDLAQSALQRAALRTAQLPWVGYRQGDLAALADDLDGRFDLVVIADALYYLRPPITEATLGAIAARVRRLLVPGGLCLLADHSFFAADAESRLTRRIHRAFTDDPGWTRLSRRRRFFYVVDVLVSRA